MFGINPWVLLGALALWIGTGVGAYFYGHNEGYNAALAQQAAAIQKDLSDFESRVASTADAATEAALAEFKAKTAILDQLGAQMSKAQGTIDAAAFKLSASLRGGACVLQPAQRRLLECIRRPDTAGCSPGADALLPAVPAKSRGP